MTESDRREDGAPESRFAHLKWADPLGQVTQEIEAGKYVDGKVLAAALRVNGQRPIRPVVLDYLCRYLEGSVKPPKGPQQWASHTALERQIFEQKIANVYHYYKRKFTERRHRYGSRAGFPGFDCTPAELAGSITARAWLGHANRYRHVQNIASSRK